MSTKTNTPADDMQLFLFCFNDKIYDDMPMTN